MTNPQAEIEIFGLHKSEKISAAIDTGFDGYVCLSSKIGVELGLILAGFTNYELADGSTNRDAVYNASVEFLDKRLDVDISLTDSDETLIGTSLLEGCHLTIDFVKGSVKLKRKK